MPNAIGALCLNQAGQDQLSARPSIIPGIFSIFTSERHLKVLRDKENAVLIGTSIDELVRHHPSLKTPVFDAVKSVFSKIEDLGNAFVIPDDKKEWYGLLPVRPSEETGGAMQGIEPEVRESESGSGLTSDPGEISEEDSATQRDHDNNVVMFIDVICRVSTTLALWCKCANCLSLVPRRALPTSSALQGLHSQCRWVGSNWKAHWSALPPV